MPALLLVYVTECMNLCLNQHSCKQRARACVFVLWWFWLVTGNILLSAILDFVLCTFLLVQVMFVVFFLSCPAEYVCVLSWVDQLSGNAFIFQLVQLMGRTVDLHYLISQRINSTLMRSLDVVISRFETLGFTSIVVSAAVFILLFCVFNNAFTSVFICD